MLPKSPSSGTYRIQVSNEQGFCESCWLPVEVMFVDGKMSMPDFPILCCCCRAMSHNILGKMYWVTAENQDKRDREYAIAEEIKRKRRLLPGADYFQD